MLTTLPIGGEPATFLGQLSNSVRQLSKTQDLQQRANILAQMQGSAVFMLSAMFWGEITIKDGRVEQANFPDYRVLHLAEMPKVELVLAPSGGFWGGIGEPGQASIAPAVCNAIFAVTGKRIRKLPIGDQARAVT